MVPAPQAGLRDGNLLQQFHIFSDYYDQQNYGFAISLRKPIGELDYVKLEYRLEQYRIDAEGNAPIFFWQQDGYYLRSHVELSYTIDTRDAQIFPRKGGKFEVLAGYSGLGGDVHTYNFGVNGSYYWNLRGDTISASMPVRLPWIPMATTMCPFLSASTSAGHTTCAVSVSGTWRRTIPP